MKDSSNFKYNHLRANNDFNM